MKPTKVPDGDGEKITHPAFAQLSASRVMGSKLHYGSEFNHRSFISLRIKESYEIRNLSTSWHHESDGILELSMTEAQWATFVSSLNTGGGVPVTLEWVRGQPKIPEVELLEPRAKIFRTEYKQAIDGVAKALEAAIAEATTLKVRKSLLQSLQMALQSLKSSAPFVEKQFGEHVEKIIEEAKMAANAYAEHLVQQTGIKTLKGPEDA